MKKLLFGFMIMSSICLYSQTSNDLIDVIESSKKSITPDVLVIDYEISVVDKNEKTAMTILKKQMDMQIDNLLSLGFSKEKLKLSDFSLEEKSEWDDGKNKNLGYEAKQSINIRLLISEKEIIDKLMESLSLLKIENVHINISTELSSDLENKTRLELIGDAIKSATQKATVIANGLNVKIGKVHTVEYGDLIYRPIPRMVRFVPPRSESVHKDMKMDSSPWGMLGSNELEISEKIHIIWKIE